MTWGQVLFLGSVITITGFIISAGLSLMSGAIDRLGDTLRQTLPPHQEITILPTKFVEPD